MAFRLLYYIPIKIGGNLNISMVTSTSIMYKTQAYTVKPEGNGSLKGQIKLGKLHFEIPTKESLNGKW
jgi:hypothetical protein